MNTNWTPTIDQLKRGIVIAEQIQRLEAEMSSIFKGQTPPRLVSRASASPKQTKKRGISAAGRERIAAAQRARWAKIKRKGKAKGNAAAKGKAKAKAPKSAAKPQKKKGGLTPAGRARLAALMKARWAARKQGAPAPNA
jgi:flagellar biosynthesis/type III secretory pathway protein FliH